MGIDVEHYIKLWLDYLLDTSTYELLTESQADQDIDNLWKEIHDWTIHHRSSLPNDTVNFIRGHMNKAMKDPLRYFYLLIKLHRAPCLL